MGDEFNKTALNTVTSTRGFSVEAKFAEISYEDAIGHIEIYAEWLGSPTGVVLYKQNLKAMSASRVETVLSNVTRALEYLGHRVAISADD